MLGTGKIQCLLSSSVLYLPEGKRACMPSLVTSYGDKPAIEYSGYVLARDICWGLKYSKDESDEVSLHKSSEKAPSQGFKMLI